MENSHLRWNQAEILFNWDEPSARGDSLHISPINWFSNYYTKNP